MDVHWSDGQVLSAALVAVTSLVGQLGRWRRRPACPRGRGVLAEVIAVLPAGSRVEERRPDGTVVRVELPGGPAPRPER